MHSRSGLGSAALLACVLLGISGCSGESDPPAQTPSSGVSQPSETSQPPTTTSTTTSVSDEEAAIAGAQQYVSAFNAALDLSDSSLTQLPKFFTSGCRVCKEDLSTLISYRDSQRSIDGGTIRYSQVSVDSHPDGQHILLTGILTGEKQTVRDANGTVIDTYEEVTVDKQFLMVNEGSAWRVEGLFP